MSSEQEQIDAYTKLFPDYLSFSTKMKSLIEDLLKSKGIYFQLVEARPKSINGFAEKLSRAGKRYIDGISEMPNLCGCRIITYYLEDIKESASLINDNFDVIEEELSHLPAALEADKFGYISAHYIVKLKEDRSSLPEWASYSKFKAEIQIRTVIQHAWSAVSHAMQYKAETEIPSALRRRLFRIAGLFELADEEFGAIRDQRETLRAATSDALTSGNLDLPLTVSSIEEFSKSWKGMGRASLAAQKAGFYVVDYYDNDTPGNIYDLLRKSRINSIEGLNRLVSKSRNSIFSRLQKYHEHESPWQVSHIFILYLLLIDSQKELINKNYLIERNWSPEIAEQVCKALND